MILASKAYKSMTRLITLQSRLITKLFYAIKKEISFFNIFQNERSPSINRKQRERDVNSP